MTTPSMTLPHQIPNLKPHIRWCSCQLQACTILQNKTSNPFFREFEQKCAQDPRTGGLPLSSFLLKPMQRVTRYPLLMKRVRPYCNWKTFGSLKCTPVCLEGGVVEARAMTLH